MNWQTAHWADGPRLAEWCERNIGDVSRDSERFETYNRAIGTWREGRKVQLRTVDMWLTHFDHHLCELPDSVWTTPPTNRPTKWWLTESARTCEGCGGPIPTHRGSGRRRSLTEYRRSRWCCDECRKVHFDPKPCATCGEPIPTHDPSGRKRRRNDYAKMLYCSTRCQWATKGTNTRFVKPKMFKEVAT